jgi:hypothetical protein
MDTVLKMCDGVLETRDGVLENPKDGERKIPLYKIR